MFGKSISPEALIKKASKAKIIIKEVEDMLKDIETKEKDTTEIITDFGGKVEEELINRNDSPIGPKLKIQLKPSADKCIKLEDKDIHSKKNKLDEAVRALERISHSLNRAKAFNALIQEVKNSKDVIETVDEIKLQQNVKNIKGIMVDIGFTPTNTELILTTEEQAKVRQIVRMDPQNHQERKLFITQAYPVLIEVYSGLYNKDQIVLK